MPPASFSEAELLSSTNKPIPPSEIQTTVLFCLGLLCKTGPFPPNMADFGHHCQVNDDEYLPLFHIFQGVKKKIRHQKQYFTIGINFASIIAR
jgi:hypothetical protein